MNIPESLLAKILAKKCILFLGAGATKESGGVLGNELGKHIYNSIGDIGIEYKENLAKYTQLLVNAGYRDEIETIVRSRFSTLKPSSSFSKLSSIPWKAIYTTNYDDLIEKSYQKQHFYKCIVSSPLSMKETNGGVEVPLYKINGDINSDFRPDKPLVITLNDLRNNKKNNEKMISQLMRDMNDTFIFIGYSFQDENEIITDILDAFEKNERWESVKEKYVILPSISEDIRLELQSYKINYIEGTADSFFSLISQEAEKNYFVKLNALKENYSSNELLKNFEAQTLQYIHDNFDIYSSEKLYSADGSFYYHGGRANWGIIKEHFDINRNVKFIKRKSEEIPTSTDSLYYFIEEMLQNNKLQKIKLDGTAISGKTTTLYRCAYDLSMRGILSLIYKQQAKYKDGLLSTIYDQVKNPFVIFIDDIFIDISEAIKMINEAERGNLPILFFITSRYSDWENTMSTYNKNVLSPFDATITMTDYFNKDEATNFVEKLISSNIISVKNSYEKNGYIKNFEQNNNIIQLLIELIDNTEINKSICNEYDQLSDPTKYAYGIVSIIYKYGYKTKWEILQRTIASRYSFSWEDFVAQILHRDAKGNLYEDETQGIFYLLGRHRYICDKIVQIHFGGYYTSELATLKEIICACSGVTADEHFMGGLIHSILQDENGYYSSEQLLELLDFAIDKFENPKNCAFVTHLKGEYYLNLKNYLAAIRCFTSNVQNELNEEYSLHSLGKTYYYLAQREDNNCGEFRMHMDLAIEKLCVGMKKYSKNEYYYALLISIFTYLQNSEKLSEKNIRVQNEMEQFAIKNLGQEKYNLLLANKANSDISME